MESGKLDLFLLERALATEVMLAAIRPGHPPGRVGFGSGKKSPVFFLAARARPDPVAGP